MKKSNFSSNKLLTNFVLTTATDLISVEKKTLKRKHTNKSNSVIAPAPLLSSGVIYSNVVEVHPFQGKTRQHNTLTQK